MRKKNCTNSLGEGEGDNGMQIMEWEVGIGIIYLYFLPECSMFYFSN